MDLDSSFAILGLDRQADADQAKRAYKSQVRRWHPDQFPEGSATKAGAEERLKQINIAYAQVKAYLARWRPPPAEDAPQPPPDRDRRPDRSDGGAAKRSWVDHLFDTLNAFAGHRGGDPTPPAEGPGRSAHRRTFEQVLDEMTGGEIPVSSTPRRKRAATAGRTAAAYQRYRPRGGHVGPVERSGRVGPVKPVGRVRGIGRTH